MLPDHQRIEFRCNNKLHGVKKEYPNGKVYLEIRCKNSWCVDRTAGELVFHYFDLDTGELHHTKKYKDPVAKVNNQINSMNRINGRAESSDNVNTTIRKVK